MNDVSSEGRIGMRLSSLNCATTLVDARKRHRLGLILCAVCVILAAAALFAYGWDYYLLDQASRPFSRKHAEFKPGGSVGLRLGFLGLGLFALIYLYPLRKHWAWLGRFGNTRNWLDYHIVLGLTAPVVITFHSSFKAHGFAGMAYWTTIALVISGLVGRYFYSQIPRSLNAAELSLKELQDLRTELTGALAAQNLFTAADLEPLFRLPDSRKVESMPLLQILPRMIWLDIVRPVRIWSLRRRAGGLRERLITLGGILHGRRADLERVIALASGQALLAKRLLFLARTHRIFHLWHVIHRPFSMSLAIFIMLHVAVVTWLGFY